MNRFLHCVNFCGVLLLASLCVWQWRTNRETNLDAIRLEKNRIDKESELSQVTRQLGAVKTDLENFREQLREASTLMKEARDRSSALDNELHQVTGERDQLKESVSQWVSAVKARDEELKRLDETVQKFAADRNKAVTDFNQLAEKYNGAIAALNSRTTNYNALVEKYNALAKAGSSK